jgi:hypothetical protein
MPTETNRIWPLALGGVLLVVAAFSYRAWHRKMAPVGAVVDAGGPAARVPLASNEAKVTRYKDEGTVATSTGIIQWAAENVFTEAEGGDLIVTVRRGTNVDILAQHGVRQLIVFTNPGDPTDKLMGWMNAEAFSREPPHPPPVITCAGNEVAILVAGGGEACVPGVTECKTDSQCSDGWVCDGQARKFKGGKPDALVQFCRVGVRLPGYQPPPPPPADTGTAKHK